MKKSVRVELYPGVLDVFARSPEMRQVIERAGEAIAAEAKRIAPKGVTHQYSENIGVTHEADKDGLVTHVNANWFTSHWIEFGTVDTPVFAVLRKASESGAVKRALQ